MSRPISAVLAGFIAIVINSLLLWAADFIPLATAHGGLLRLLQIMTGLHVPATAAFKWEFHGAVGVAMALVYAFVLEPLLRGGAFVKGFLYALAVWILNSVVVLPITGEGFAGARDLTFAGIGWFAVAHTVFFVTLALLYAWFRGETSRASRGLVDVCERSSHSPTPIPSAQRNST